MAITKSQPPLHTTASSILQHAAQPYNFHFSAFLRATHQVGLSPERPICKAFQTGSCPHGTRCAERHVTDGRSALALQQQQQSHQQQQQSGFNSLVCKHWLRGLCKKGEHCEFLHEYNLRKMPECNFFMRNGYCSNGEECLYLHVDPLSRLPPCPHYDMGFCPLGPLCAKKHVRRRLCPFYMAGFCPDGPECRAGAHARWSKDLEKPVARSAADRDDEAAAAAAGAARAGGLAHREMMRDEDGERDRDRDRDRDRGRERGEREEGGRHGGRHGRGRWRGGGRGGRFRGRGH
ncbi:mRNA 3'-end-processing protein YTH1 [Escovopsis weberi]|uniref:mRNA 3'-end-processing protein n=1 Tax=Escovopsis weberi TaxID=150374 RepID=A0A0M8MU75_ESCWE|nr:mRNA 3'-end-processing protein YTH1 [Escovopsis weberi]